MLVTTKKDKGLKHILKQAEKLGRKESYVTVGVHKDATYPDGLKVAQNAFWQHEGTRTIPARPFIRKALKTEKEDFTKKEIELLNKILEGKEVDVFLKGLGFNVEQAIRRALNLAPKWAKKMAASTKLYKQGDKKKKIEGSGGRLLFESGSLLRSIGYEVTNNGQKEVVSRNPQEI